MGSRTEVKDNMLEELDPADPRLTRSSGIVGDKKSRSEVVLILLCFLAYTPSSSQRLRSSRLSRSSSSDTSSWGYRILKCISISISDISISQ